MSGQGFPWTIFNSNTLRPMMVDVLRAAGHEHAGSTGNRMKKEESLALLRKVEEHGLDAALKDFPIEPDGASASASASASTSKRKHQAPAQDDASAEPARKRGRARQTPAAEEPAAPRTRSKASDSRQGLLTRRQAAQARGDNLPPTRSWRASTSARQPRKPSQKAVAGSSSISAPLPAKPKPNSKAQVFDGVVLIKRPESYAGKGKAREQTQELEEEGGSDEDADGEVVEDGVEIESSSLENSNKENDPTFLGIANAETDGEVDAEGEDIIPVEGKLPPAFPFPDRSSLHRASL
ncbi:hypothetical protein FB451DRAFT_1251427 [Mycena latifolia]|nr:hypothetical protein FB451DRAFT_1251427 [Mycena latifolia]